VRATLSVDPGEASRIGRLLERSGSEEIQQLGRLLRDMAWEAAELEWASASNPKGGGR
jgi:hypothetical protein